MVCLDDTSGSPDLDNVHEVHRPFVLLICFVDDAHSLDIGCETRGIDRQAEIFDKHFFLFGVRDIELYGEEGAVESFLDVDSVVAVGRGNAEIVCC